MPDNKIDMFKLVQEVEKQKAMNIDEIFSDLDSVKNEEVKVQEPRYTNSAATSSVNLIRKPTLPDDIGTYNTRFEAFKAIIEHVYYGTSNAGDYVQGHSDALEYYFKDAYANSKDLYVVEARVNDEINKFSSRAQLYQKGYYDGLFYVLKALKRSKELIMVVLNREINSKL
jgi:hypothetical protein